MRLMRAVAFVLVACRSRAQPDAGAPPPPPPSQLDAGRMQISLGSSSLALPHDWPGDVPIYPGSFISQIGRADSGTPSEAMFETTAPPSLVESFYRRAFDGHAILLDLGMMTMHTLVFDRTPETVSIVLMGMPDGKTHVTLALEPP